MTQWNETSLKTWSFLPPPRSHHPPICVEISPEPDHELNARRGYNCPVHVRRQICWEMGEYKSEKAENSSEEYRQWRFALFKSTEWKWDKSTNMRELLNLLKSTRCKYIRVQKSWEKYKKARTKRGNIVESRTCALCEINLDSIRRGGGGERVGERSDRHEDRLALSNGWNVGCWPSQTLGPM